MSARYVPVSWNRNKIIYDIVLVVAIVAYLAIFIRFAPNFQSAGAQPDDMTLRMRAFGSCAFVLLTLILCIGPLARLDERFLPLLYNRRHFGVLTCAVALAHSSAVIGWYFNFSPLDPYVALLSSNTSYGEVRGFPFEVFGIAALLILVVLAATSHDFWLSFLTPPVWKALHMGVYLAYALIVLHIALGGIQSAANPALPILVGGSALLVGVLHVIAGRREVAIDGILAKPARANGDVPWIDACDLAEIPEDCAKVVSLAGSEKIAIFRYDGKLSAVTNLCAHQNGPLGEGRIIDGCITCPWHGFQYRPADGRAPPPFTEKLATYRLKLEGTRVLLDPRPNPRGTFVEPVVFNVTRAAKGTPA